MPIPRIENEWHMQIPTAVSPGILWSRIGIDTIRVPQSGRSNITTRNQQQGSDNSSKVHIAKVVVVPIFIHITRNGFQTSGAWHRLVLGAALGKTNLLGTPKTEVAAEGALLERSSTKSLPFKSKGLPEPKSNRDLAFPGKALAGSNVSEEASKVDLKNP
jgi:hypothetical protein